MVQCIVKAVNSNDKKAFDNDGIQWNSCYNNALWWHINGPSWIHTIPFCLFTHNLNKKKWQKTFNSYWVDVIKTKLFFNTKSFSLWKMTWVMASIFPHNATKISTDWRLSYCVCMFSKGKAMWQWWWWRENCLLLLPLSTHGPQTTNGVLLYSVLCSYETKAMWVILI